MSAGRQDNRARVARRVGRGRTIVAALIASTLLVGCSSDPGTVSTTATTGSTDTSTSLDTPTTSVIDASSWSDQPVRLEYRSGSGETGYRSLILTTDGQSSALHIGDDLRVIQNPDRSTSVCWRSTQESMRCSLVAELRDEPGPTLFDALLAALVLPFDALVAPDDPSVPLVVAAREGVCSAVSSPVQASVLLVYCRDRVDGFPLLVEAVTGDTTTRPLELITVSPPMSEDFVIDEPAGFATTTDPGVTLPTISSAQLPVENLFDEFGNADTLFPKLDWLTTSGVRYPVVFIGSSHTFRGFVPQLFDELRPTDDRTPSLNLGVPNLGVVEAWFLIRQLVRDTPGFTEIVLLDPQSWAGPAPQLDDFDSRFAYWHDIESLGMLAVEFEGRTVRQSTVLAHIQATMWTESGITEALRPFVRPTALIDTGLLADAGYESLEALYERAPTQSIIRGREELLEGIDLFLENVEELAQAAAVQPPAPSDNFVAILEGMSRFAADSGFEIVITEPPGGEDRTWVRWATDSGIMRGLLFNDPNRYPELFDPDLWWDRGHLSEQGATLFTTLLAEEFSRTLGSGG